MACLFGNGRLIIICIPVYDISNNYDFQQGLFRSTVVCNSCKQRSVNFEPFMFLTLPIPPGSQAYKLEVCCKLITHLCECSVLWQFCPCPQYQLFSLQGRFDSIGKGMGARTKLSNQSQIKKNPTDYFSYNLQPIEIP